MKRPLWLLYFAAAARLLGADLGFSTAQNEIRLEIREAVAGKALLLESRDLSEWSPVYALWVDAGLSRIRIPTTNAQAFYRVVMTNYAVAADLAWIPAGEFLMGSPDNEPDRFLDEGPQRRVWIQRGFWLSQYETTAREFMELMPYNPSATPADSLRPIDNVSFQEAEEYCRRRTARDRALGLVPPGCSYRLPSEAEWEYAGRAGTTTKLSWGDDPTYMMYDYFSWCGLNAGMQTHPVGAKSPNRWGIHDMVGNVFEWCLDAYGPYPGGVSYPSITNHVYRGGSYVCSFPYLRSASRHAGNQVRAPYIGFRVLLGAAPEAVLREL